MTKEQESWLDKQLEIAIEDIREDLDYRYQDILNYGIKINKQELYKKVIRRAFDGNLLADIAEGK